MPHKITAKTIKRCEICLNIFTSFNDSFDLNTCSSECYSKKANRILNTIQRFYIKN
jgi:protein-arginine kinase activator protein McsA